jgi:hypothetical protein
VLSCHHIVGVNHPKSCPCMGELCRRGVPRHLQPLGFEPRSCFHGVQRLQSPLYVAPDTETGHATSSPEPLNPSRQHTPNRVNLPKNGYCLGGHTCTFAGVWPLHLAAKAGRPRARGAKPSDASPCGHAIMIIAIAGDAPACHACAFPCAAP